MNARNLLKRGKTAAAVLASVVCLAVLPDRTLLAQIAIEDAAAIGTVSDIPSDEQILDRINEIYSQLDTLSQIGVSVQGGVVLLTGEASNTTQAQRAVMLAERVTGVVTVEDQIERVLDVQGNLVPIVDRVKQDLARWARASPLLLLAAVVFGVIAYAGHALANWSSLWRRIAPNSFLAELITQAVRVVALIVALLAALSLVGASTLMQTILGGAGLLGLAIGFAMRDAMENYISSIMLSLRQPFRANEHVVIDSHEARVIRLTSRATVLMTLNGNHLRIPNATVYKAVILNYTRNPERRFDFELGVDADDDPLAAMQTGVEAVGALDFVLNDPKPDALITAVGDSNILITFTAWINQDQTEFQKARSLAIRAAKLALEAHGFTLPEPIYRLRFDPRAVQVLDDSGAASDAHDARQKKRAAERAPPVVAARMQSLDVSPDSSIEEKVNDERRNSPEADLLDGDRPVE